MNFSEKKLQKLYEQEVKGKSESWMKTCRVRKLVAKDKKQLGCLSAATMDQLLDWKLRRQRGRTEKWRTENTGELLAGISGCAFRLEHTDSELLARIRLGVLMAIPGVGIGVASAILALGFPKKYAVIDRLAWKALYGQERTTFSFSDYDDYLRKIESLASKTGYPVQTIDYLLWKSQDPK